MLTYCNECGGTLSTEAAMCPHCGFPAGKKTKRRNNSGKHVRLPNGFGQITKVKGNLRNPYRAMVTIDKSPEGKCICKILKPKGYFKTYNEAYKALIKYHENPFNLSDSVTCQELYDMWMDSRKNRTNKNYSSAWRYCGHVYKLKVRDLRARDIKTCIYEGTVPTRTGNFRKTSVTAKYNIKYMFCMMLDYAIEHELIDKNYARDIKISDEVAEERKENYKGHSAFSKEEFNSLCENMDDPIAEMVIIQCYMGWRPGELVSLRKSDVDLENMIITGGSKTKAGKNRIVPIHKSIQNIITRLCDTSGDMLFSMSYEKYRKSFKELGLSNHTLHDCRKHFVTMAKKYNLDEYAIKRIVGHSIEDLTENVYTERDVKWLHDEISKIPDVGVM